MFVLAAHTGARRSEIMRSEVTDFDLTASSVQLRELKRTRGKRTRGKRTMRRVPLTGRLQRTMRDWLAGVKGRSTFSVEGEPLDFARALMRHSW